MDHVSAQAHRVYLAIPMERLARAQCYGCGTEMWAEHLIWIAHPPLQGYLGLCASCYSDGHADVERQLEQVEAQAL